MPYYTEPISEQMATISISASELRASLDRDGFVRIPQAFTPEEISQYRSAASHITALARQGQWPHVRTLPKQFPPWNAADASTKGIWGVQHLLHPDMPGRGIFAESYFNTKMIDVVTKLLRCDESDLVMELYNMLVRPEHEFALRWHRDDIGPDVSAEEELERLQEPMLHVSSIHAHIEAAVHFRACRLALNSKLGTCMTDLCL